MRRSSQILMGAISLASVVTGVQLGATASTGGFVASPQPTADPVTPDPTTSPSTQPSTQPSTKPTPKPTTSPTKTTTPAPKPPVTVPSATVSHTSSPVYYRFGTVQLTVTKTGSKITDITLDQAGATNGRYAAFAYLVQLAITAQSASFDTSMMTGATYTTQAFVQALDNALSQF